MRIHTALAMAVGLILTTSLIGCNNDPWRYHDLTDEQIEAMKPIEARAQEGVLVDRVSNVAPSLIEISNRNSSGMSPVISGYRGPNGVMQNPRDGH